MRFVAFCLYSSLHCKIWWRCGFLLGGTMTGHCFLFDCLSGVYPCLFACWPLDEDVFLFLFLFYFSLFLSSVFNCIFWMLCKCVLSLSMAGLEENGHSFKLKEKTPITCTTLMIQLRWLKMQMNSRIKEHSGTN